MTTNDLKLMKAVEQFILTVCLTVFLFHTASTIICWVCRSDIDPGCGDPFDNSTLVISDCAEEKDLEHLPGVRPTMCRKIRQKVHGEWRYFRSCAYMGEPGIEGDERYCSKDGCNTAGLLDLNKILVWITTLSALVMASLLKR